MNVVFALLLLCVAFLLFFSTSCEKSNFVTFPVTKIDSSLTDTTEFLDITLNGKRIFQKITYGTDTNWTWWGSSSWTSVLPDTIYYPLSNLKGGFGANTSVFDPSFYFLKNGYGINMPTYVASYKWWDPIMVKSFIDSFFSPGTYEYAIDLGVDTTFQFTPEGNPVTRRLLSSGIQLTWTDSAGTKWQTSHSSANQTGSNFHIMANTSTPFTFISGYSNYAQSTLITVSFQCNLYDHSGHVLNITNGRFRKQLKFELF